MQPQFLVRHFPAPKLQLHANLVSAIEEFFAVTHFCQVIVLVDVHPEFEFFQPSPCWSPVPLVFGNVVSEFSERDDFADRRIRRGRNLHQIKPETLSFAQGIGQFQDAQLFACGTKDDPDFASANPTVYAKLVLQFNQSPCSRDGSAPSRRIFLDRNLRIPPSPVWPEHSGTAAAAIDRGDGLTLIIASQGQVVGNIFTLARRIWS